ncbi:MAG: MBL fold metallo-hydrolase [Verrucomicrobiota bacterium]
MEVESITNVHGWVRHLKKKTSLLRTGGSAPGDDKRIGLLPREGWRKRNVDFLQNAILPSMFVTRGGRTATALTNIPTGKLATTWIGHASFLLQTPDHNIAIDPNWALWHSIVRRVRRPGLALRDLPDIDLVLVSHAHFDHLHRPSLQAIANRQPIVVPQGVGSLVERLGFGEIHELKWWESKTINGVEITLTPARHWGARYVHDVHRGFGGFLIGAEGKTVFHSGDSAYFDEFTNIGSGQEIDLALLPIGAYDAPSGRPVHMNPEEAVQAFVDLKARTMVPMHYGTFPLGSEPIEEPVLRLAEAAVKRSIPDQVKILEEGYPFLI